MIATIRMAGQEVLPRLEPLWLSLRQHHAEVAPQLGAVRVPTDSWNMRQAAMRLGWRRETVLWWWQRRKSS